MHLFIIKSGRAREWSWHFGLALVKVSVRDTGMHVRLSFCSTGILLTSHRSAVVRRLISWHLNVTAVRQG